MLLLKATAAINPDAAAFDEASVANRAMLDNHKCCD